MRNGFTNALGRAGDDRDLSGQVKKLHIEASCSARLSTITVFCEFGVMAVKFLADSPEPHRAAVLFRGCGL
jgi:hypothetical protein